MLRNYTLPVKAGRTTVAFLLGLLVSGISIYPCCLPVISSAAAEMPACHQTASPAGSHGESASADQPSEDHTASCMGCPACQPKSQAFDPFLPQLDWVLATNTVPFIASEQKTILALPVDQEFLPAPGQALYLLHGTLLI